MRIFFITFAFITVFSVYPEVAYIYNLPMIPKVTKDSSYVVADNKKIYKTRESDGSTYASATIPTKLDRNTTRNNTGFKNVMKLSGTNSTSKTNSHMNGTTKMNKNMRMPLSKYKDGEYKGSVGNAYYGYVQTRVIVKRGKVSDVKILQSPNSSRNSIYINSQALPYLKQEVIRAQSGNVNVISGATYTSEAFMQSTESALASALNY